MSEVNVRIQFLCGDFVHSKLHSVVCCYSPYGQSASPEQSDDSMRRRDGLLPRIKLFHEHKVAFPFHQQGYNRSLAALPKMVSISHSPKIWPLAWAGLSPMDTRLGMWSLVPRAASFYHHAEMPVDVAPVMWRASCYPIIDG